MAGGLVSGRSGARDVDHRSHTGNGDDDNDSDVLFVMGENNSIYELSASTTAARRELPSGRYHAHVALGASGVGTDVRPSSVVMLRPPDVPSHRTNDRHHVIDESASERQSWWDDTSTDVPPLSCVQLIQLSVHAAVLAGVPVALLLAAYYTNNRAVPFIFSVVTALASYEFAWLAYRVALRVFLPFKLHQKQTCRDIYAQIMSYSVDLQTCAITPLAERFVRGHTRVTALVLAIISTGVTLALCLALGLEHTRLAYCATSVFVGVLCAALAPNVPDGVALLMRFSFYVLASMNVVETLDDPMKRRAEREDRGSGVDSEPLMLEPFALALLTASLLLMNRVVTCKDAMESTVCVLLDVTGLLVISGAATVLGYFARAAASSRDGASGLLLALCVVAWSAELGSWSTERFLKFIAFPWNHPLAKRVSTRQNVEKLVGSVAAAAAATVVLTDYVAFHIPTPLLLAAVTGAVVASHVAKLLLVSLKKLAHMSVTGEYFALGGGVLDRIDTLLVLALVLCPVLEASLIN